MGSNARRVRSRSVGTLHLLTVPANERPLRLEQVAEWLGVSTKTVRRQIESGKLRSIKVGGIRMVTGDAFQTYWNKLNGRN